ncbi:hypothetical protein B0T24DRAFT_527246 [Lasiosphaeria ovina]|uniref:UBA domain-containing protein n=1 Tax=Lasiosphaeria ovina TaxID=92902 RepID=A0AAE0KCF2_9PEZI|nr:hypothetical protein B0T24DRAFT_527246 [Lasiosphaeria ovina]
MDDLSGLSWSAPKPESAAKTGDAGQSPSPIPSNSFYPTLRPTPSPFASGRNTPLSTQGSGNAAFKPPSMAKPAQDSFSNLVAFSSTKSGAKLSLREQQERLEAEKRRKEEEKRKQVRAQYGDGQFWDSLGQGQSASLRTHSPGAPPAAIASISAVRNGKAAESDNDLFAAFNSKTKVDNSSYYPPPAASHTPSPANVPTLNLSNSQAWAGPIASATGDFVDDDDDPFGLSQLKTTAAVSPAPPMGDDDDLLGDLGKPVDQVRRQAGPSFSKQPEPGKAIEDSSSDSEVEPAATPNDPFDNAVAQLVDYGFTPENARRGLTESSAGLNVQAAVNWLLDDAHRQAKEKAKGQKGSGNQNKNSGGERASSQPRNGGPAWARDGLQSDGSRSRDNRSPASVDSDFTKTAAAVGSTFLKTANTLWKTSQKKVQKAVSEFQQDGDPSQPKWMRSTQQDHTGGRSERQQAEVTDEAMLLELGGRPERRAGNAGSEERSPKDYPPRDLSPALPNTRREQGNLAPKWQQAPRPSSLDPRSRLSKQAVEEQTMQAYVSPARRKKTTPQPPPELRWPPESEPDLLFGSTESPKPQSPIPSFPSLPSRPIKSSPAPSPNVRQSPVPSPRPAAPPPREIPNVSAIALQSSTKHRLEGTAHFKRGDFAAAHASYTFSLGDIPQTHPLAILLLCNRSLTALKTGEPRQAVEDADSALRLIGPGKGEGEHIELHGADNEKRDMRELYGKALTRKAEALEQMEKWADAGTVWQMCVESGLGGPTAIAGRQRCQKALAPKPAARPPPRRPAAAPRPRAAATKRSGDSQAVLDLRKAEEAAKQEGIEKFALVDQVDAKIAAWRDGKRDNLRALLSSLDNILWEGSGWKKVGLHELIVASKVKIIYMKAIAKTHPDKIAQDSSTEVRMIASTVFSTLNEAWDKFKSENGL